MSTNVTTRACVDCGHRWPQPVGPWIDVLTCPACSGDETEGLIEVDAEMEFLRLTGETA